MLISKKKFLSVGTVLFPLLCAMVLSVESYLNIENSSLCQTTACEVVGQYIRFDESILTAGGAVFFWILTLALFFANRYPEKLPFFPLLFLFPALAFDGVLIGFQFVTIRQQCVLCIAVATALIFVSLLYCFSRNYRAFSLCVLLVWSTGFAASSIIVMPEPQNAYSRMVLYTASVPVREEPSSTPPKVTLIFSMQCPHCLEVVRYLSENEITEVVWQLAATDVDARSIAQLGLFLQKISSKANPFVILYSIKKQTEVASPSVSSNIEEKSKASRSFLSNLGLTGVPVLVVEESASKLEVVNGAPAIIQYLEKLKE